jgi:hypothetical protein
MIFVELQLILAFFGRGDDGLFHCYDCRFISVIPVARSTFLSMK